jgi:uncharacterized protein (TIGR03437 family)
VWISFAAPVLVGQTAGKDEVTAQMKRAERARNRQEEFYRVRAYPMPSIPAGARLEAIKEMERMMARERAARPHATAPAWVSIGPSPTNTMAESSVGGGGAPFSSGRVTALAVDPRNGGVVYLGGVNSGVWKTTDGGHHWTPLTDNQPSLAIGSIALAPTSPDIIYVGTGEQNNSGDSYYGAGVLKSIDGGATWVQLPGPFVGPFGSSRTTGGGARIGAMAVHPTDPNIVLAAVDRSSTTASGIYRSADGGSTWKLVLGGQVGTDVVFHTTDGNTAYAALGTFSGSPASTSTTNGNGIYKSTDGGVTWTQSNGSGTTALPPSASIGRISLGMARSSPTTIYAGIASSNTVTLLGLYKTTDGGQTWTRLLAPDYCTPQCFYDNVVRVSPVNANTVFAAGLPIYRSLDGGITWTNIVTGGNGLSVHTDHHALAFTLDGAGLYDGDDGGVYSTGTPIAPLASIIWNNLNSTLAITEFSANISIDPGNPQVAYAGTQDNGTQRYSGNMAWDQVGGGDGGVTAIDTAIPGIWYGTFEGGEIYKFTTQDTISTGLAPFALTYPIVWNGINQADRFSFYGAYVMNPSNPLWLYFGTNRLWETADGEGTWDLLSGDHTNGTTGTISAIGISPSSPRTVATGSSDGKVYVNANAGPGGYNGWVDVSTGLPGRAVNQVAFDPLDSNAFYVTLSGFSGFLTNDKAGHVFKTSDSGQTWSDISSNLPNIPVNDIVLDPDLPGTIYIATDIGVFQSTDDGTTWSTLSTGLPRVVVQGLTLHRASRTLRAVTRGRSAWDLSIPLPAASKAPHVASYSPTGLNAAAGPVTLTVTGSNFAANSTIRWNGVDRATTFVSATSLQTGLSAGDLAKTGRNTLIVFNPAAGGGLSNSVNVPIGPVPVTSPSAISLVPNPAAGGVLVPGSIATIYGTNLAGATVTAAAPPLPYFLGDVTVEVEGFPAPMFYVSPGQINFQVPWEMEDYNRATVTIRNGTLQSAPLQLNIAFAAPALFSYNGTGSGQGAILIAGSGLNVLAAPAGTTATSRPAKAGETISIFCTGLGPVSRIQNDGVPKTTTPLAISQTPVLTIGGVAADVSFAGLAPGGVGLYQINATVPDGVASGGAVAVVASMSGVVSNTVTVAVQ